MKAFLKWRKMFFISPGKLFSFWRYVVTFWLCRRNGFIRKVRLISKFMTTQLSWQAIAIHIFYKISHIPISHKLKAMKFDNLIEYNEINIFLQTSCRIWGMETSSRPFFVFFKTSLYEIKANGLQLDFNMFG